MHWKCACMKYMVLALFCIPNGYLILRGNLRLLIHNTDLLKHCDAKQAAEVFIMQEVPSLLLLKHYNGLCRWMPLD